MAETFSLTPLQGKVRQGAALFVASMIGLYFEMLVIRWLAAELRLFSFFKNVTMMAAFLGLGVGFALAGRRRESWPWFIPLMFLYVPIVLIVGQILGRGLVIPESGEYFMRISILPPLVAAPLFALIVVLFFVYTMFLFIPAGHLIGNLMIGLKPITAYVINLLGSLAGMWLFAAVSFFQWAPWVWFGLGLILALWFLRASWVSFAIGLGLSVFIVGILGFTRTESLWSPYYRVDIEPLNGTEGLILPMEETGYNLLVNQIDHMTAVNLSPEYLESNPEYADEIRQFSTIYNLPYSLKSPASVLVVGAGTGNDVAAALRHGVLKVDAVEIDPLVYDIALHRHPENPYQSQKVEVFIDDARAFIEKTDRTYDLIVFGILDSQTLLSGMSSVRLDNFVYTLESIEQVKERLNEDGMIAITFFSRQSWVRHRIGQMMAEVFGAPPVQLSVTGTPWTIYISGYQGDEDKLVMVCEELGCTVESSVDNVPVPLATDDWPYLYLNDRSIPLHYWIVLCIIVSIAWVSTQKAFPKVQGMDWHFFFLGGAFLLIEFKSITELALLFGSTWIVNVIAVSAVLVMVLLANLIVARLRHVHLNLLYALLFVSLLISFFIPLNVLLPYGSGVRMAGSALLMGLPLFFASAIFATSLKRMQVVTLAFASNFFGSAVGGVLEYSSLAFGISSLYLLGAVLYFASWVARPRT